MGPSIRTCRACALAVRPNRSDSTDFSTPAITFATTQGHYLQPTAEQSHSTVTACIWREPGQKTRTGTADRSSQGTNVSEMIMSTTYSAPVAAAGMSPRSMRSGLAAILRSWWAAYIARRIQRAALMQLQAMSDRALQDIGLTRSQIRHAVMGKPHDRPFDRHC